MGLVAPRHVGSSQTRTQTRVPRIGRWILNHCATREALVPALHCEILLVTHQHVGLYMVGAHMVNVYWMEQNGLQHCFSSTYSEDSFTVLYFSLPLVGYFCRELCRSRKINLLLYFPGGLHIM